MFPPTRWQDIEAYDHDEVVEGFLSHERDDPVPGPNHSDGFRWGWLNAHRDRMGGDDGFDHFRRIYIAARQNRSAA